MRHGRLIWWGPVTYKRWDPEVNDGRKRWCGVKMARNKILLFFFSAFWLFALKSSKYLNLVNKYNYPCLSRDEANYYLLRNMHIGMFGISLFLFIERIIFIYYISLVKSNQSEGFFLLNSSDVLLWHQTPK
jgi:hypothetical protein